MVPLLKFGNGLLISSYTFQKLWSQCGQLDWKYSDEYNQWEDIPWEWEKAYSKTKKIMTCGRPWYAPWQHCIIVMVADVLAPHRCRAKPPATNHYNICVTSYTLCSKAFETKYKYFLSRKCISKFKAVCKAITCNNVLWLSTGSLATNFSDILTHWGRDKMDAISQTTSSSAFSWMKMFEFWLKFQWSLFLRAQLTIFQHWFR